jgi:flavin-dependent dehydrogenase
MIAMFVTDGDECHALGLATVDAWGAQLRGTRATRDRLAAAQRVSEPEVLAASSQHLRRTEHRRSWLAAGDAAIAVDPITGGGVVRALRSAQGAAATALACLEGDPAEALPSYETTRDADWASYLQERSAYYALERRWEEEPFWARRHASSLASAALPAW